MQQQLADRREHEQGEEGCDDQPSDDDDREGFFPVMGAIKTTENEIVFDDAARGGFVQKVSINRSCYAFKKSVVSVLWQ